MQTDPNVLIVGAGPAGLAAALELHRQGVRDILIIDRDDAAGGLPRFCAHPGFGIGYALLPKSGPRFAAWLIAKVRAAGIQILTGTTMISLANGPSVTVTGPSLGYREIRPKAVILATGIREANRGNRMLPGDRPASGVLTTGLLQQMVARQVPFPAGVRDIIVVGSEHVSFSAIMTARKAGLRVRMLVEEGARVKSFKIASAIFGLLGGRTLLNTRPTRIIARDNQVVALEVEQAGQREEIPCDAVLFSAGWMPETAALVGGAVEIDKATGGVHLRDYETTVPGVFAAGNCVFPLKASGKAARSGEQAGRKAAAYLRKSK